MMYFVVATRSAYGFPVEIIYFFDEAKQEGSKFVAEKEKSNTNVFKPRMRCIHKRDIACFY